MGKHTPKSSDKIMVTRSPKSKASKDDKQSLKRKAREDSNSATTQRSPRKIKQRKIVRKPTAEGKNHTTTPNIESEVYVREGRQYFTRNAVTVERIDHNDNTQNTTSNHYKSRQEMEKVQELSNLALPSMLSKSSDDTDLSGILDEANDHPEDDEVTQYETHFITDG